MPKGQNATVFIRGEDIERFKQIRKKGLLPDMLSWAIKNYQPPAKGKTKT